MFCTVCGTQAQNEALFCTACGSQLEPQTQIPESSEISTTLLTELIRLGLPVDRARRELITLAAKPDEVFLATFENVAIRREFAGNPVRYYGIRISSGPGNRSPILVNRILRRPPKPINYKVPMVLLTNKRIIFCERSGQSIDFLASTRSWDNWLESAPGTNVYHIRKMTLYLSPQWVLDPKFCEDLDKDFKEDQKKFIAPHRYLENSKSLRDRLEWRLIKFAAFLRASHNVVASERRNPAQRDRIPNEWSWVGSFDKVTAKNCLAVKLLHVNPGQTAGDDERWYEGNATIQFNSPYYLEHFYHIVQKVRSETGALDAEWNREIKKREFSMAKANAILVPICLVLVWGIFFLSAKVPKLSRLFMMAPMMLVLLLMVGSVAFVIGCYVLTFTSKSNARIRPANVDSRSCGNCGKVIAQGEDFCTACGVRTVA